MSVRRLSLVEGAGRAPATPGPVVRVAIATQDMKSLDAHFGSARKFAIYEVDARTDRFVAAVEFGDVSDESGSHRRDGDDRIGAKIAALAGCNLLFVLAIGGPAAVKVVNAGIHPVKIAEPESIESILGKVRTLLAGEPPAWLRKALGMRAPRSMHFLDEEDRA